ncbi:MAG: hypothetical protein ACAI38_22605 [Myxococcota bacterium]|nr:hypothetical protein [Myxococcota bacterium]
MTLRVAECLLVPVLLVACGRTALLDARTEELCTPPVIDLGVVPSQQFGPATLITELAAPGGDDDPTLTGDMLEIFFESQRSGTSRIWHATRDTADDAWDPPTPVSEFDGLGANTPEVSRDGLRLRFATTLPSVQADLYEATRPDRASSWSNPVRLDRLDTAFGETGCAEFLDGYGVVFFSNRSGSNQLWQALREASSCTDFDVSTTTMLGVAGANPWMRNDGLTLAYSDGDLYVVTRAALNDAFGTPQPLSSLNSGANDDDPWMNDDMTRIFFTSVVTGDPELYTATR